ncbi:SIMPL domain-containing protein [Flavimarina sp. Hel_I_48]|uniref:SIMPL domain-containing protein n=1 Tax=Flavimarina sp. Hel_I_48 TaxID=1392488 RepID=UPI0004DEF519|nr:SIMPL domain-containing protein [Flavimarina sp. Hel_I_48]
MKLLLLNICIFFAATTMAQNSFEPLITVSGKGEVTVVPDQVTISLGVETTGKEAEKVKAENDRAIDAILKYALKQGISQNNITTQYINLNKNYNYEDKSTQYTASQIVKLKLENLDDYENVMTGLVSQGVNSINGIEFGSSKMDEYEEKARTLAMKNAKNKAEQYVGVTGQKVGPALMITEAGANVPQPRPMMKTMSMMESSSRETLAPGEMTITERVEVSFKLGS